MLNRRDALLGAVVALTGSGLAISAMAAGEAIPEPVGSVDVATLMQTGPLEDMVMGKAEAPVTIIEYASMGCSHCADFTAHTLPAIKAKYINTGKAKLIFRELPLESRSTAIFMLARCVTKERYYPFIETLFGHQEQWLQIADIKSYLLQTSKLAGLTEEQFTACLANQDLLNKVNAGRERGLKEFGITGTPTFFINGKKYVGALSLAQMSAIIENELASPR
ncbi:DsbA family protein [Phyllobacterium sp. OV277]|uniref:DsbA family protein n=1 Tax=Phyllobacterium sp. OV277 TaxID=1882772 RepID=UPI00088F3B3B|nr:DsbA family protein [Phyllobacterium sp. OV277]SDO98989.1 Thiol:disulfide interchange protein DsbA [Phyllobacterium sp. OV277]